MEFVELQRFIQNEKTLKLVKKTILLFEISTLKFVIM